MRIVLSRNLEGSLARSHIEQNHSQSEHINREPLVWLPSVDLWRHVRLRATDRLHHPII